MGALLGAVAADAQEDGNAALDEEIDHFADFLLAAGGGEDGAAVAVDVVDELGGQDQRRLGLEGEALVAVADAEDFAHAVVVVQFEEGGADDVVEAGAQAAASDDGRAGFPGLEEELLARAGLFEIGVGIDRFAGGDFDLVADAGLVGNEIADAVAALDVERQRRIVQAGAEVADGGIDDGRHGTVSVGFRFACAPRGAGDR